MEMRETHSPRASTSRDTSPSSHKCDLYTGHMEIVIESNKNILMGIGDWVIGIDNWGFGIGDCDWGLGLGIRDWDGGGIWDWDLELGIGIWNWELRLGIGIWDWL